MSFEPRATHAGRPYRLEYDPVATAKDDGTAFTLIFKGGDGRAFKQNALRRLIRLAHVDGIRFGRCRHRSLAIYVRQDHVLEDMQQTLSLFYGRLDQPVATAIRAHDLYNRKGQKVTNKMLLDLHLGRRNKKRRKHSIPNTVVA